METNTNDQERKRFLFAEAKVSRNKQKTMVLKIVGIALFALGIIFGILLFQIQTTATVTEVMTVKIENEFYEKYELTYKFLGKEYIGIGMDRLEYNELIASYDIELGDEYSVYASILAPSSYHFKRGFGFLIVGILFCTFGIASFLVGFILRKKFLISIHSVGDLNNDGKINEADLQQYVSEEEEKERLTQEKIRRKDFCKYCGSKLAKTDLFCTQCGARREE